MEDYSLPRAPKLRKVLLCKAFFFACEKVKPYPNHWHAITQALSMITSCYVKKSQYYEEMIRVRMKPSRRVPRLELVANSEHVLMTAA
jgi:hypothetical protein